MPVVFVSTPLLPLLFYINVFCISACITLVIARIPESCCVSNASLMERFVDTNTERMHYILTVARLGDNGVRLVASINLASKVSWRRDNTEVLKPYRRLFPAECNNTVESVVLVIAFTMNSCCW